MCYPFYLEGIMYKEIKESTSALESKLVSKWKSENLLEKTIKTGKEKKTLYSMMDQYMLMLNQACITYLQKL